MSGSSGHLVVERPIDEVETHYPGRIFEDPALDYPEAMRAFVAASAQPGQPAPTGDDRRPPSRQADMRQLRQAEAQLRQARRGLREQRQQADAAWQVLRQHHRQAETDFRALTKTERRPHRQARHAEAEAWHTQRDQRRHLLERRRQEDEHGRQQRHALQERLRRWPIVTAWIAILVVTDNCTRQCLGLPLFVAGAHVTADLIVAALRTLLPADLQFLISDRGVHFTAQVFQQLARSQGFLHVVIARHRPESNGIAERLVRTLKEALATHAWENDQELLKLLEQLRPEYNDRPHQGLGIPGLSPNEFAKRIWLM